MLNSNKRAKNFKIPFKKLKEKFSFENAPFLFFLPVHERG